MLTSLLFLLLGLVVLLAAGECLVRGAASLAKLANVPPLIIGLTVVAFGTSAPELVVTIQAVAGDAAGIAMGNIVGSNIANVLLVLGLPACIMPIAMVVPKLKRHAVALLLATAVFCGMVYWNGEVGLPEAIVFTLGMVAYFSLMAIEARSGHADAALEAEGILVEKPGIPQTIALTALGLIGLPIGATLLVTNGSEVASLMGVRDEVIGLTVVAFGTSLPELATVLAAALRRDASVSAGTIIGSNIFNMLFVGSAAGYVGTSTFSETALRLDLPVMLGATALITGLIFMRRDFGRTIGLLSITAYVAYILYTGLWAGAA
ncbi:calcium/sodium antiporter [Parvularcula sp. ZS-1/3]|uniref:Calcium/sodium antiporter n=1 Tax=Parvularcula mediterranea TaxID=2732508 RepID=A0A7Y3RJR1_9PROT|nr:calcium/sodium antiporter [Parvularcula mediterranea]NNU15301.1 calcium/sodium antiporter [Parvularcula mediterranea]